ncbi:hypothetical protein Tco_0564674 [Tanacetum coccineum]
MGPQVYFSSNHIHKYHSTSSSQLELVIHQFCSSTNNSVSSNLYLLPKLLTIHSTFSTPLTDSQMDSGLVVPVFNQGDDLIACLNKIQAFQNGLNARHYSKLCCFQMRIIDAYDSDCDDVSNVKAVLMDNLSNYGSTYISDGNLILNPVI